MLNKVQQFEPAAQHFAKVAECFVHLKSVLNNNTSVVNY